MNRLYSIQSQNGKGYNLEDSSLELEKDKEYYQIYINNEEGNEEGNDSDYSLSDDNYIDPYQEYIIETKPGICSECEKDLSVNEQSEYKNLYKNEGLFIFTSKNGDRYFYIYYHYCKDCLSKKLYNWSKNNDYKYPSLRVNGNQIINIRVLNVELPKNIEFPTIYYCDYYLSNGYRFLDNIKGKNVYSDKEKEMHLLLDEKDKKDKRLV